MAWGAKVTATQLTSISATEQFFNVKPALGLGDVAVCQVKAVFQEGDVDPLRFDCYSTLDGSSEQFDSSPFVTILVDPGAPVASFIIRDRYKFRVGTSKPAGSTETATSADLAYRSGISL